MGGLCQRQRKGGGEMGRIVISENVSLDGVIQDPAGVEGFRLGGWVGRIGGQGRGGAGTGALRGAPGGRALLFGPRGYRVFGSSGAFRNGPLAGPSESP